MDLHRQPAARRLRDFRIFDPEEPRYRGPGEIDVEDPDGVAGEGEGERQLAGYGGFSHAAFAREDLDSEAGRVSLRGMGGMLGLVDVRVRYCGHFRGAWPSLWPVLEV